MSAPPPQSDLDSELAIARAVLGVSGTGYAVLTRDGAIRYISPELAAWVGFDHTDVSTLEEGFERVFPDPLEHARVTALWAQGRAGDPPPERLVPITHPDGTQRWLMFRYAGRTGDARVFIAQDYSATRRAEDALRTSGLDDEDLVYNAPLLAYLYPGRFAEIGNSTQLPFPAGFKR